MPRLRVTKAVDLYGLLQESEGTACMEHCNMLMRKTESGEYVIQLGECLGHAHCLWNRIAERIE